MAKRTAIVYATKTGTTKKCAEFLSKQLINCDVIDSQTPSIDLSKYDVVIIGSNIRYGQINKKIKKLINTNMELLKTKSTAYYICCGFSDNYKTYFENNIPKDLRESAIICNTFGGEIDISKQKGFDKFIVGMVKKTKEGKNDVKLLETNIIDFAKKINAK